MPWALRCTPCVLLPVHGSEEPARTPSPLWHVATRRPMSRSVLLPPAAACQQEWQECGLGTRRIFWGCYF